MSTLTPEQVAFASRAMLSFYQSNPTGIYLTGSFRLISAFKSVRPDLYASIDPITLYEELVLLDRIMRPRVMVNTIPADPIMTA